MDGCGRFLRTMCNRWERPVIQADRKAFAARSDEERELSIALRKKRYEIARNELKELLDIFGTEADENG